MTKSTPKQQKENVIRVFFALWPEPATQKQLSQISQTLKPVSGGRSVRTTNIHLTLAFLGNIVADRLPELKSTANQVTAQPFSLILQEIDYWKRNKIVYAKAKQFPLPLYQLEAQLKSTLSENRFKIDQNTFKPHITLLRHATLITKINLDQPIQWHVKRWCLIQSTLTSKGANYSLLDCWPLTPSD